jgi:hypothetical protein
MSGLVSTEFIEDKKYVTNSYRREKTEVNIYKRLSSHQHNINIALVINSSFIYRFNMARVVIIILALLQILFKYTQMKYVKCVVILITEMITLISE